MNGFVEKCDLEAGDCIAEKYAIEKTLGEGTFGKVFKVKEQKNGKIYALKLFKFWEMIPKEREMLFARFKMEWETGQIDSNYLVKSIDHGILKGNPFIVMEFCPQGDLLQFIHKQKNVDIIKIGKEILFGLNDLHIRGKVHRDLKPENTLIRSDGTAVLTDFGLSGDKNKRITQKDLFGRPAFFAGTVAYMAPEQAKPKNMEVIVLPTMDIFAFGVVIYYLVTYKYPFGELNSHNDLVIYLRNAIEGKWNRALLMESPDGAKFEKVITGCLKSDYKDRLQKVDSVLSLMPPSGDSIPEFEKAPPSINGILLRVMQGEEYGSVYKLNELVKGTCKKITMGRSDFSVHNTLSITENLSSFVSRKHCTLELSPNKQWYIRDGQWDKSAPNGWKNSKNGTFVNSTEATFDGLPIHTGDIITIGDVKLKVEGY